MPSLKATSTVLPQAGAAVYVIKLSSVEKLRIILLKDGLCSDQARPGQGGGMVAGL